MPLFASQRDSKLLKHFFKEKMHKFDSIEVEIYKLSLPESNVNLYNESVNKVYYNPVRFFCTPTKEAYEVIDVDTNIDTAQLVQFFFLRDDLVDKDFVIESGDVIKFDERFYEVDNAQSTQYWAGRNPQTLPVVTEGRLSSSSGYNVGIVAQTHLTRPSQLNIVEVRSGVSNAKSNSYLPKNL